MKRSKKIILAASLMITAVFIATAHGVTSLASTSKWSMDNAFDHKFESNGRIEYDYENDGNLSGSNDIVIDADDIKALEKKSEVTLYGNFVADTDSKGDSVGTGTLYIRIGENPDQGN